MDIFGQLMNEGYYFDKGIDLKFYNKDGRLVYMLETPESGVKPSITVKGTLLEGMIQISTYVSIQNLSYSLDLNEVSVIECRLYYFGMEKGISKMFSVIPRNGKTLFLNVLYTDQDKEPPNRSVRFQCVVASECREMMDIPVYISNTGLITVSKEVPAPTTGSGSKSTAKVKTTLLSYLQSLVGARNTYVNSKYATSRAKQSMLISSIEMPKHLASMMVYIDPNRTVTFWKALEELGYQKPPNSNEAGIEKISVSTFNGRLCVKVYPPVDWEQRAEKSGAATKLQKQEFYDRYYENDYLVTITGADLDALKQLGTKSNPIPLNFVKAAFRTENLIKVIMMYDDRVRPGSWCKIVSTAIMGKGSGTSGFKSRIFKLGKYTVFRVTGKIDYEFSTTEQSMMTFLGPVEY